MTRAPAEHEGPSIWGWGTAAKILRKLRLELSRKITPLTEEMVVATATDYDEIREAVRVDLQRPRQCPAGHPVTPFELRASMTSERLMGQVFPNAAGSPVTYVPIRGWLCLTCQTIWNQRDLKDA